MAAHALEGHARDADLKERFLHGVQPFGSDDASDQLHGSRLI